MQRDLLLVVGVVLALLSGWMVQRYLRSAEAAKAFNGQGADASPGTADELAALIKSDLAVWGKVIREHGIRGE